MAGCMPCFIIPLLLFIFHRYIQPVLLKYWNPWVKIQDEKETEEITKVNTKKSMFDDKTEFKDILRGNCCVRR
ncbi:hypothetical protein RN001_006981 [Aquatica leii]|uniref:Uncharacterized protein n=1 Tax=Aquatica leii TaxID=1421715 RepID=A0AAN7PE74_9COLE|nr:hypothetical protein RN001_006981 [Aquatica leii]